MYTQIKELVSNPCVVLDCHGPQYNLIEKPGIYETGFIGLEESEPAKQIWEERMKEYCRTHTPFEAGALYLESSGEVGDKQTLYDAEQAVVEEWSRNPSTGVYGISLSEPFFTLLERMRETFKDMPKEQGEYLLVEPLIALVSNARKETTRLITQKGLEMYFDQNKAREIMQGLTIVDTTSLGKKKAESWEYVIAKAYQSPESGFAVDYETWLPRVKRSEDKFGPLRVRPEVMPALIVDDGMAHLQAARESFLRTGFNPVYTLQTLEELAQSPKVQTQVFGRILL
ncbi:MAG: hypothetical protein WCV90_04105 [Candidatus Woesearchaeota archaeon]|jgi:hypothetical protein